MHLISNMSFFPEKRLAPQGFAPQGFSHYSPPRLDDLWTQMAGRYQPPNKNDVKKEDKVLIGHVLRLAGAPAKARLHQGFH